MQNFIIFIEKLFSSYFPFTFLILTGIYLSIKGGFFQFTRFGDSIRLVKKSMKKKGTNSDGISSIQSAFTALSATVGTGNIAGVAGAISLGGAGAVFWMWISALLGMAIKFTEINLSIIYREKNNDGYIGGPMYIIKKAFSKKGKILSVFFSFACLFATFLTGNITQTNTAVESLAKTDTGKLILGIILAIFTALCIKGGCKSIGRLTEKIVPVMSVMYLLLTLGLIVLKIDFLPTAFKMILIGAFKPKAVTGGIVGSILTSFISGASRGVFSNEAGLGTSSMAHSMAFDANAKTQGLFGIFEVFLDTIVICTLTALTILCSGVNIDYGKIASGNLVVEAISCCYGNFSSIILGVMILVFAFSSVIGWSLYGIISAKFLFGKKGLKIFEFLYPLGCIFGALCNVGFAWRLSELFNGIMLCLNLPIVLVLCDDVLIKGGIKNDRKKNVRD